MPTQKNTLEPELPNCGVSVQRTPLQKQVTEYLKEKRDWGQTFEVIIAVMQQFTERRHAGMAISMSFLRLVCSAGGEDTVHI